MVTIRGNGIMTDQVILIRSGRTGKNVLAVFSAEVAPTVVAVDTP